VTLLEILRRLGDLVQNWDVIRVVLDTLQAFLRGETVPVVITWERYRLIITIRREFLTGQAGSVVSADAAGDETGVRRIRV
jgi:hypothetical protein